MNALQPDTKYWETKNVFPLREKEFYLKSENPKGP